MPEDCFICGQPTSSKDHASLDDHFPARTDSAVEGILRDIRRRVPMAWTAIVKAHIELTSEDGDTVRSPLPWQPGPIDNYIDTRSIRMRTTEG